MSKAYEDVSGQWSGTFSGTNSGTVVLDLDNEGDHARGSALAFDSDPQIPNVIFEVLIPHSEDEWTLDGVRVHALHPTAPQLISRESLGNDVVFPETVDLKLRRTTVNTLNISWTSNIGTTGEAIVHRTNQKRQSDIVCDDSVRSWDEFVLEFRNIEPGRFIFRGQADRKRLRTSFHRTRRKDLVRYLLKDLPQAHMTLTGLTNHFFRLQDPVENAAFLNLLQHHGFPTPLLDWTYSPFVAAFFAYRYNRHDGDNDEPARIFMFDKQAWTQDFYQVQSLAFAMPHFSIVEAFNFENPRSGPQQALSTVTSVDDIESYIHEKEGKASKRYLRVFDVPFAERGEVMEQLRLMGITAASLFPGLDGACEELRGRFFHPI